MISKLQDKRIHQFSIQALLDNQNPNISNLNSESSFPVSSISLQEESEATTLCNLQSPFELSQNYFPPLPNALHKKELLVRKLPSSFNVLQHINLRKMKES